jgi:AcrR family transcriptional regulator
VLTRLSKTTQQPTAKRKRLSATERREVIELAATEVFAEHGYARASIDAIAKRSGVSPPVVYDHFESKKALHRRLLERHYAEMRSVWAVNLAGDDPIDVRMPRAFDAWFGYIETHPYAARMLFSDTTGDLEIKAFHREVQVASRALGIHFLAREPGAEALAGSVDDPVAMEMAWEVFRASLQGLAIWWQDNPEVPRAKLVEVAMNALWVGFDRARAGETWRAD